MVGKWYRFFKLQEKHNIKRNLQQELSVLSSALTTTSNIIRYTKGCNKYYSIRNKKKPKQKPNFLKDFFNFISNKKNSFISSKKITDNYFDNIFFFTKDVKFKGREQQPMYHMPAKKLFEKTLTTATTATTAKQPQLYNQLI